MRKDFKNLDIYAAFQPVNGAEWQKANGIHADWKTPEHIEVKPVYTKEDLEGNGTLGLCCRASSLSAWSVLGDVYVASLDHPPVCRLFHSGRIKCLYRRNLASGQKGLSVAFDLATHRGYDPTTNV